ncbi:MAG: hypothetical protein O7G85_17330, partial [Planctomycetota bacterium]|nr:hypothetical protein [Planctomycetota bacterium]
MKQARFLSLACVGWLIGLTTFATVQEDAKSLSPREAALGAGRWIRHHQIETEHGLAWPVVPDESNDVSRILYSGTPGVILFFLELHRATGDASWLDDAKRGADDLQATLPESMGSTDPGLWTGLAGQAFTLHRVFLATNDEQYLQGAKKAIDLLKRGAIEDEDGTGVHWNDVTDIIAGTAGIGLFLIYAANEMDDPEALNLAMQAGVQLMSAEESVVLDLAD